MNPTKNNEFSVNGRLSSFRHAFRGVGVMLSTQINARIHAAATAAVAAAGFYLDFSRADWCWVALAVAAVWTAEALNTAVELLADAVSPDYHPLVGQAKDVAAGAVLIAAAGAAVIGILVIGPHLPFWPHAGA